MYQLYPQTVELYLYERRNRLSNNYLQTKHSGWGRIFISVGSGLHILQNSTMKSTIRKSKQDCGRKRRERLNQKSRQKLLQMNYPAASGRGIFKSNERPKGRGIKPGLRNKNQEKMF